MRLIKSDKVIPLVRLILMNHPKADAICENMQELVDIHTIEAAIYPPNILPPVFIQPGGLQGEAKR